eukprot:240341-Chlamydomonas_euryale.AAC.18
MGAEASVLDALSTSLDSACSSSGGASQLASDGQLILLTDCMSDVLSEVLCMRLGGFMPPKMGGIMLGIGPGGSIIPGGIIHGGRLMGGIIGPSLGVMCSGLVGIPQAMPSSVSSGSRPAG